MNIESLIIGIILGASLATIILTKIFMKELKELDHIVKMAIALSEKYHDRLMRIGYKVIDEIELIGDKLTTEIIDIITEDFEETKGAENNESKH